jgi:hypothetical protein
LKYCIDNGYEAEDARDLGYLDKAAKLDGSANLLWHVTDDFCLPPGNQTGWLRNATQLYQPGLSPGGGWVASATVTGTDTVLYSSIGLGHGTPTPNPDQIGNFTYEVPSAGVPLSVNSNGAKWVKVQVKVSTTATGLVLASTATTATVTLTEEVNTPLFDEIYLDATFEGTGTLSFTLDAADDDVDDEDSTYTVEVYAVQVHAIIFLLLSVFSSFYVISSCCAGSLFPPSYSAVHFRRRGSARGPVLGCVPVSNRTRNLTIKTCAFFFFSFFLFHFVCAPPGEV